MRSIQRKIKELGRRGGRSRGVFCLVAALGLCVAIPGTSGCASRFVKVEEVNLTKSVPMFRKPVSQDRMRMLVEDREGVLFDRERGIHTPMARPYFFGLKQNRGEMIVQELDGPDYQAFIAGEEGAIARGSEYPLDHAVLGFSNFARNGTGEGSALVGNVNFFFMTRSGPEVLYVTIKEYMYFTGYEGRQPRVVQFPGFLRYDLTPLLEASGGPTAVRVDRENGWIWVIPVRDGAVDTSRIAIAVLHATLDVGDPNVMGYEIAPAAM